MKQSLVISNKLLSIRGRMEITDLSGRVIYENRGELALFNPTWRVTKRQKQVATIRKKWFSFAQTWLIESQFGSFRIRKKLLSFSSRYRVIGGPFDNALITGNIWGLKFNIKFKNELIARGAGKIITIRDSHRIEILQDGEEAELLTVIAMTIILLDKKSEQKQDTD